MDMRRQCFVELHRDEDLFLKLILRLQQITQDLPRPESQTPRLVHFIGTRHKNLAIKALFPHNHFSRRQHGFAHVAVDNASIQHEQPILIIDTPCQPNIYCSGQPPTRNERTEILPWTVADAVTAGDQLYCRLFFPFEDVVCIFLDDFATPGSIIQLLDRWSHVMSQSQSPRVKPRLLIVTEAPLDSANSRNFLALSQQDAFDSAFATLSFHQLGSATLSSTARYRSLKEVVVNETLYGARDRQISSLLFSAVHLQQLIERAALACVSSGPDIFDYVSAARSTFPGSGNELHIATLIGLAHDKQVPYQIVASSIASALLMDAYPPRMHYFDPKAVYSVVYAQMCSDAINVSNMIPTILDDIRDLFVMLAASVTSDYGSARLRRWCLSRSSSYWAVVQSNIICLCCLKSCPQHYLACGHSLCDTCVRIFGRCLPGYENLFLILRCVICDTNLRKNIMLKAVTAGVRIICIDGGGVRGCIPLENLLHIQYLLDPLTIADCFDLACGTSSGGIIVLGIFGKRWSVRTCTEAFNRLSQSLFNMNTRGESLLSSLKGYVRGWLSDEFFSSHQLEEALRDTFNINCKLFGWSSSCKFAVTTCSIEDGTPFLMANYNVEPIDNQITGYHHVRPVAIQDEPHIWEAARATSAAPMLYRSINIASAGTLMDGGLKHNNPARLASWEARRLWPRTRVPDVLLSLGTGDTSTRASAPHVLFRNIFSDGFIARLFRSSLAKLDGEVMWKEFTNGLDNVDRARFKRINPYIPALGKLYDTFQMESLRTAVRSELSGPRKRLDVINNLISSNFYLILHGRPEWRGGRYHVRASIRCRVSIQRLIECLQRLGANDVCYYLNGQPLIVNEDLKLNVCQWCQRYRRHTQFVVDSLQDYITLAIGSTLFPPHSLSGFPQTIQWFVDEQGLDSMFGAYDHDSPGRIECQCDSDFSQGTKRHHAGHDQSRRKRCKLAINAEETVAMDQCLEDRLATFWRARE